MPPRAATYNKVPERVSVHIRYLANDQNLTLRQIQGKYPNIRKSTIHWHMQKSIESPADGRRNNKGRKPSLSDRDTRQLNTSLLKLREEVGDFHSTDVQRDAGLEGVVSNRTVRRTLKKPPYNYQYTQCRKKGQLTTADLSKRLKYAKKRVHLPLSHWTHGISFYLDAAGWVHKTRPSQSIRTGRTRTWKRADESLSLHCTAKGRKEGVNGTMAKFFVAIAHGKGVVGCTQYSGQMNGIKFAEIVEKNFPKWIKKTVDPTVRVFLQDGDPSQVSQVANIEWKKLGFESYTIPARSPDLNPIENFFHLIGKKLKEEAQNLEKENYTAFCQRVKRTILNFDQEIIDRTIESMPRRLQAVIKRKGTRTKY